jgi:hypothetical protein
MAASGGFCPASAQRFAAFRATPTAITELTGMLELRRLPLADPLPDSLGRL